MRIILIIRYDSNLSLALFFILEFANVYVCSVSIVDVSGLLGGLSLAFSV